MRKALATLAIAAVASMLAASEVVGGSGFSSRVTIQFDGRAKGKPPTFHGGVKSERASCESGRKVVLFGQASGAPAERLDKTHTNDRGRWRIRHNAGYPNFVAEVKRSSVKAGTCRGDVSRTLHVD
jgi:hypothetical protein